MIKSLPLDFLGVPHRFTICKYLHLVSEISVLKKCGKYAIETTDDGIHSTQYYISARKTLKTRANKFVCLLNHAYQAPLTNIKIQCQMWPEKSSIFERSGIHYVAMVTKLLSFYCGAHLLPVEYFCKESIISDTNYLRYISVFIIFEKNLVELMTSSIG